MDLGNDNDNIVTESDTVEKDTDHVEVSKIVEDIPAVAEPPSDANADKEIIQEATVKEVTDFGDDSSLHVSNLTR